MHERVEELSALSRAAHEQRIVDVDDASDARDGRGKERRIRREIALAVLAQQLGQHAIGHLLFFLLLRRRRSALAQRLDSQRLEHILALWLAPKILNAVHSERRLLGAALQSKSLELSEEQPNNNSNSNNTTTAED